ncbi:MAG: hypothetical protein ACI4TM_09300 [Candidatus Cryptobacteroides sp.]
MKYRVLALLTLFMAFSACRKDFVSGPDIVVPEFLDVKYDFGTFLENRYAVLSATLNTDEGIKYAGFMIGYDEASLNFQTTEIKDLTISCILNFLEYDTDYCFYAKAGNGINEIRTRLIRFRTPKKGEEFVPIPEDPPQDGDNPENPGDSDSPDNPDDPDGPDNPGDSEGEEGGKEDENPEVPTPILPPEGVGITISDSNFLKYLLTLCDKDNDGVILSEEAASVEEIVVCTDEISTLDGIQYFTSVKNIEANGSVWKGKLTSVALNYNGRLERFSCRYNHITSILLPASLLELDMRFNNVTKPDFSCTPNLKKLDCFGNGMTELNLEPLKSLQELVCGMNNFATLDVSWCPNLELLDLSESTTLKTVYIARGQKIKMIIAENNIEFKYKD